VTGRARICMYVPYLYPAVSGGDVAFAGGIEVQLALLARGLVRRGFEVDIVACDFGQPDGWTLDGVRLLRCWSPTVGLPIVRFFHPRLTTTTRALWRSNADVYLYRGGAMGAGLVYDVARLKGRPFVFMTGHDHDVMAAMPDVHGFRDRWWYRRALMGARVVVCQTEGQRAVLKRDFDRDSVVIMNSVEIPPAMLDAGAGNAVLWLATYKEAKRPDWFTRFAERHPDVQCVMAGVVPMAPLTDEAYRRAVEVSRRCPNLEVSATIPHERIGEFMSRGAVFSHTSPAEGFPNTFLEAWSLGLPTVTCFDPDGIIVREGLGERHDRFEDWEAAVLRWLADPALRRAAGARARAYAVKRHSMAGVVEQLEVALLSALGPAHRT
jgi:glycosyltransferase involved in cell wall biosynthesis